MAGSAVIVALQQLKGLLGITHFTKKMALIPVLSSVFHNTDEVHPNFFAPFLLHLTILYYSQFKFYVTFFAVVVANHSHGDLLLGITACCKTSGMFLFLIFYYLTYMFFSSYSF